MYRYIVKDAMDDIQDVADGIKELERITGDPKLAEFQNELRNMRGYLNRMLNVRIPYMGERITYAKRSEPLEDFVDYMDAEEYANEQMNRGRFCGIHENENTEIGGYHVSCVNTLDEALNLTYGDIRDGIREGLRDKEIIRSVLYRFNNIPTIVIEQAIANERKSMSR